MFYYCASIETFPDISKWNTKSINEMNQLFSGCISSTSKPFISNLFSGKRKD